MPSTRNKKLSTCCIGRDPPSPDGPAPRPARAAVRSERRVSKDHIPSWAAADTAQLQAIFEEDTVPPLSEAIPQHKSNGKSKLVAMLEGDKSETDTEVKLQEIQTKKSSSTLKAVAQRLKVRLSKDSALSKRHSRSSVGTSEEEIERRAELRRIRERRIREELSNERVYDDDAKSISSRAGAHTPSDKRGSRMWFPGDYIPLPALMPPALPYPTLLLPHISPLDKSYDPLLEYVKLLQDGNCTNILASSDTLVNSTGTLSRRHSSPVLLTPESGASEPRVYFPSRKRSSLPPMPASPLLEPTRLPSIAEPSRSSWRLSFTSEHRGEHLRKLSYGQAIPVTFSADKLNESARPTRYLHSKGLRMSSQAVADSEENTNLESLTSHSQACSLSQDFGGVDGVGDGSTAIHLHEMGISQRLASRVQSSSSPQLSTWGSHERGASSNGGASNVIRAERARYMQNTSDSVPLSERIPQSWGQVIQGSTSSVYPSAGHSLEPSRESSRFNLSSLLQGSRNESNAEEPKKLEGYPVIDALKNVSTSDISSSSLGFPLAGYQRRPTVDDSSVVFSETDSFRRIEAELSVVETRFASSEARRVPSTPVSSKFREEFDFEPATSKVAQPRNPSAFSKLARLAIRSYDGAQNMEDLLNVPMPDFQPEVLRTPASPLNLLEDEAAGLWRKALKKSGDTKAKEVGDRLYIPRKRGSQGSRKESTAEEEQDRPKGAFEGLRNLRKSKKKTDVNDHKSAAEEYQKRFEERVAVKEIVMDSWEAEMEASAARAKVKSRNIVKKSKPSGPDNRYPATWSQFPSHTRSERLSGASAVDNVDVKDFASLGKKDGEIVWCLAHENDGHHTELEYLKHKKTIWQKVQEKIDHELYRADTAIQQSSSSKGRRGSLSVAGELEYPELEVLPFTLMTEEQNSEEGEKDFRESEGNLRLMKASVDGSVDMETDDEGMKNSIVSIADPKFYEDCLVGSVQDVDADMLEEMLPKIGSKKGKYRTWAGRDWEGYKYERRDRNMSIGSVFLRRSTDDHCSELEMMERAEREKVLKAADDAWGRGK